jgi:uncharacterized protein YjbJ (UPF0337 family)
MENKMNMDSVKGKWTEIKGEIRKAWGKLTDDELEQTKGDLTSIQGLLQQKYGKAKEDYRGKVSEIFQRFHDKREKKMESIKDNLKH